MACCGRVTLSSGSSPRRLLATPDRSDPVCRLGLVSQLIVNSGCSRGAQNEEEKDEANFFPMVEMSPSVEPLFDLRWRELVRR